MIAAFPDGGFTFLPHDPGATAITHAIVADEPDVAGNTTVTFSNATGPLFTIYMPDRDWLELSSTLDTLMAGRWL